MGFFGGKVNSKNVRFASASGCKLDSDLVNGGGTDDTLALQAILDALHAAGGGVLVLDGVSRISDIGVNGATRRYSALRIPANVTLRGVGKAGLFLTAGSNCTVLGNDGLGDTTQPYDADICIENLTVNCNGANQAKEERNDAANMWSQGIWFTGVNGLILDHVTVVNPVTYGFTVNRFKSVVFESLRVLFTDGNPHANGDGIHIYDGDGLIVNGFRHNGTDDGIAMNFDEAAYIWSEDGGQACFGGDRFTNEDGNAATVAAKNIVIRDAILEGSGHSIAFNVYYSATDFNVVLKNIDAAVGPSGVHWGVQNAAQTWTRRTFELDGYTGLGDAGNYTLVGRAFDRLRINNIKASTTLGPTLSHAPDCTGDFFVADVTSFIPPTIDPGVEGALWNNNGTPAISVGGSKVADWEFNDLTDSSGNGHTLTNNNAVTVGTGAASFDQSGGPPYQWLETADRILTSGGSFTICIENANLTAETTFWAMILGQQVTAEIPMNVGKTDADKYFASIGATILQSTISADGNPHKIRVRYDRNTGQLGLKVDSESEAVANAAANVPFQSGLYVGQDGRDAYFAIGSFGRVRVWNYRMNDTDFAAL